MHCHTLFPLAALLLIHIVPVLESASCGSNEYCPAGWSVKRRPEDYSARTCEPTARTEEEGKCPKPYMCVASKCGINFCCINDSEEEVNFTIQKS